MPMNAKSLVSRLPHVKPRETLGTDRNAPRFGGCAGNYRVSIHDRILTPLSRLPS